MSGTGPHWGAIYLSPHLDDAVLSCGGQIHELARAGRRVAIVTFAAGEPPPGELSPLALELHRRWGLGEDAVAVRRREDREACRTLGAEPKQWEFADALYRRDPATGRPLYDSMRELFAAPHPRDGLLVEELAGRLGRLAAAGRVVAPLAAGGHVDHVLCRRAAEAAFGAGLLYYEDFPYSRRRRTVRRALGGRALAGRALGERRRWEPLTQPLGEAAIEARCRAIACYGSQLGTAFSDLEQMRRQVRRHARRVGGERLWRRRGPASPPASPPSPGPAP